MSTPAATQFATHYKTLQQSVERLRTLDVPDLDELVTLVDTANAAYRGCKARIDAVQGLLDASLAPAE